MAAALTRHCADGRLSAEELSARLEVVYRALTYGELEAVARDLPPHVASGSPRPRRRRRALTAVTLAAMSLLVLAILGLGLLEAVASSPFEAMLVLCGLFVVVVVTVLMLGSVLVTVAPFVGLALGALWLGRRLEGRALPSVLSQPGSSVGARPR